MGFLPRDGLIVSYVGLFLYPRSSAVDRAISLAYFCSILPERSGFHHEVLSKLDELPEVAIPFYVKT
jgi:hypothetical protein